MTSPVMTGVLMLLYFELFLASSLLLFVGSTNCNRQQSITRIQPYKKVDILFYASVFGRVCLSQLIRLKAEYRIE